MPHLFNISLRSRSPGSIVLLAPSGVADDFAINLRRSGKRPLPCSWSVNKFEVVKQNGSVRSNLKYKSQYLLISVLVIVVVVIMAAIGGKRQMKKSILVVHCWGFCNQAAW
jgi:hypothetical protein